MICSATLALVATFAGPSGAKAQQITTPHLVRHMNAGEYVRRAEYFRYRELFFRMKAQNLIKSIGVCSSPYAMATRTVTRAEVVAREYIEYLSKAEQNARSGCLR